MPAYCQIYGVIHFTSPVGWLPVHRNQLRVQRSVTSMGKLYLLPFLHNALYFCRRRATATGNAYRKFRTCGSWDTRADRRADMQTDIHTDALIAILLTRLVGDATVNTSLQGYVCPQLSCEQTHTHIVFVTVFLYSFPYFDSVLI